MAIANFVVENLLYSCKGGLDGRPWSLLCRPDRGLDKRGSLPPLLGFLFGSYVNGNGVNTLFLGRLDRIFRLGCRNGPESEYGVFGYPLILEINEGVAIAV